MTRWGAAQNACAARPLGVPSRSARPNGWRMWYGALAQLGERYDGIVEVSGSIPLGSTTTSM